MSTRCMIVSKIVFRVLVGIPMLSLLAAEAPAAFITVLSVDFARNAQEADQAGYEIVTPVSVATLTENFSILSNSVDMTIATRSTVQFEPGTASDTPGHALEGMLTDSLRDNNDENLNGSISPGFILTFDGLGAGDYQLESFHHADTIGSSHGSFTVDVDGNAEDISPYTITDSDDFTNDTIDGAIISFTSDGSTPVEITYASTGNRFARVVFNGFTLQFDAPESSSVPEPGSLSLILMALGLCGIRRSRRRRR